MIDINTKDTQNISHDIKRDVYAGLIVDYYLFRIPTDHQSTVLGQIFHWSKLCTDADVPFCMFGPFGRKWKDERLIKYVDSKELQMAYHHFCHLGITVDPSQKAPSKTVFVTASNFYIPHHKCGEGKCGDKKGEGSCGGDKKSEGSCGGAA